jgi:rod shape-determining protein MreD
MRPLFAATVGLSTFWIQVTLAPHAAVFGVQPDLLLITVILLGMRWPHPGLYVYAALAGLAEDSFSHGLLGVYGISFLLTGALANLAGLLVYEQNLAIVSVVVLALTLAEGLIALTILHILGSETAWVTWYFGRVVPQAAYHALLTPLAMWGLRQRERPRRQNPLSG